MLIDRLFDYLNRRSPGALKVAMRRLAHLGLAVSDFWPAPGADQLPAWLPLVGGGDYTVIGELFFKYFVELGRLKPTDSVLDVGCGMGRMAKPLTRYLDRTRGRYVGFDIEPEAIRWCNRHIRPLHPGFRFDHFDVANPNYRGSQHGQAALARFPYADQEFNFAIATSVFTHLLPGEVVRYLAEIHRVLAPRGRCFATFFLLNAESEHLIETRQSHFPFTHRYGSDRVINPDLPEAGIAFPEGQVRQWYREAGFQLEEPVHYGNWCGRSHFLDGQDVLVAVKV